MNINDLQIFVSVAEYENISKAAAACHTVQSNVSSRIKYLEHEFGVQLIKRTTRRLTLTEDGIMFLGIAKEIMNTLNTFKNMVTRPDRLTGQLKIGSIHSVAALRAPAIFKKFIANNPEMNFILKTGTTQELLKKVLSFKLDGAFVAGDVNDANLAVMPVTTEKLCIVTSAIYPDIQQMNLSSKPIKLIVFSKGCSYRSLLEQLMDTMGIKQLKFAELDSLDSIIQSVESGMGITVLPEELISSHYNYRNLVTIKIPSKFSNCPTVFIRMKNAPFQNTLELFEQSIAG